MYLLILSGLVSIQKVRRLERLIPAEIIRLKYEKDVLNKFHDDGEADFDDNSYDNFSSEDLETSGRDTEYEHNDESSEEEKESSGEEEEGTTKKRKQKFTKDNKIIKRHH